jgi:hypothetical protein
MVIGVGRVTNSSSASPPSRRMKMAKAVEEGAPARGDGRHLAERREAFPR